MATLTGIVFFSHQLGSFAGAWLGALTRLALTAPSGGSASSLASSLPPHFPIDDKPVERAQTAGT